MGQQTFGIMFGVKARMPRSDIKRDRVYDAANHEFNSGERGGVSDDHVGLWVAVGGSGHTGAGWLEGAVFEVTQDGVRAAFRKDTHAVEKLWPAFVQHMKDRAGLEIIGEPSFWLLPTETA